MRKELKKVRWGIIAPGRIAGIFATALREIPSAELVAVGSRSLERSQEFAKTHNAVRAYGSYEEVATDPDVDMVYVASPHTGHRDHTLMCLENNKAVLCEKPLAVNAAQVREMAGVSRERGVFLMEAMKTRFFPAIVELRRLLASGSLGEPRMLQAAFGFRTAVNPEGRLFNPLLAGGSLLDVGIYPVALSSMVFGAPVSMSSEAVMGETGVDEQAAFIFRHENGSLSVLASAIRAVLNPTAWLSCTEARVEIPGPWWQPTKLIVHRAGKEPEEFDGSHASNGFQFETMAAMECFSSGAIECPVMPHAESITMMETLDALRAQWKLRYEED